MTPEFARAFYGMMSAVQRAAVLEAACPPVRPCVVPAPDQLATRIEITVVTDVSEAVARVVGARRGSEG